MELALLEIRGIAVPDAVRAVVLVCADLPTLDHGSRRAARLESAAAVVRSRPRLQPLTPAAGAPETPRP